MGETAHRRWTGSTVGVLVHDRALVHDETLNMVARAAQPPWLAEPERATTLAISGASSHALGCAGTVDLRQGCSRRVDFGVPPLRRLF